MPTSVLQGTAGVSVVAVLLLGCSDAGEDDPSTAPATRTASPTSSEAAATSPTPVVAAWDTCVSTRAGLRVRYPAGWTARDYPDGGCAYFDPEPFEVERRTEVTGVDVRLDVESVPYERVRRAYGEESSELISQQPTQVAGYDAVRVEDRHTGGPLGAMGERLTYLADLGEERTLVLTTSERAAEDLARARQVVDLMARRLERTR
jgi:hypothetical protein